MKIFIENKSLLSTLEYDSIIKVYLFNRISSRFFAFILRKKVGLREASHIFTCKVFKPKFKEVLLRGER